MPLTLRPYVPADLATLQSLVDAPGVREEFDIVASPGGIERALTDPWLSPASVRLAFVDGEAAGFAYAFALPGPPEAWAFFRGGVLPRFRRQGIGRALHDDLAAWLATQHADRERTLSAWQPQPAVDGFVAALGYQHDRWYWLMERPRGGMPAPVWPEGVSVRTLDGGEALLADWTEAYNDSFAGHHRYVASPIERARQLAKKPGFRPDGVVVAYRGGRVAGFCRLELFASRGEIGTVGTVPAARGIGLGRALLRWGVAWLERESTLPVTLLVDGDNEGALALYRSEGFQVTRTRRSWARRGDGA